MGRYINIFYNKTFAKTTGVFFSQALLSFTNFLISLSLIRYSTKEEYGLYANAFATILFYQGLHNAFIATPLIVLAAHKSPEERRPFIAGLKSAQYLIFSALIVPFIIFLLMSHSFPARINWYAFAAFGLCIFYSLTNEFIKSIFYSELAIKKIVSMDLLFVSMVLLSLPALKAAGRVGLSAILFMLCAAYMVSSAYGWFLLRWKLKLDLGGAARALRETWAYSKWAVLGVVLTFIQSQGYVYIVSAFKGLREIADISAARTVLVPLGLLITSWSRFFLPKGVSMLKEKDLRGIKRMYTISCAALVVIVAAYLALVFLGRSFILNRIFAAKYSGIGPYILLWAGVFFAMIFRANTSLFLQILRKFKELAAAVFISSAATIGATFLFMKTLGASGSILALIIGEVVLGAACWAFLAKELKGASNSMEAGGV